MLYLAKPQPCFGAETNARIQAADGLMFLGLHDDALKEFDAVREQDQHKPEILLARARVLFHQKRWSEALDIAHCGLTSNPDRDEFVVQAVFALYRLGRSDESFVFMQSAPEQIRGTGIIHYNLACYESRLGDRETARKWIRTATELNQVMIQHAMVDPDLQGVFEETKN